MQHQAMRRIFAGSRPASVSRRCSCAAALFVSSRCGGADEERRRGRGSACVAAAAGGRGGSRDTGGMGDKGGDGSDEAQRAPVSSRKGGEGFGYKDGSFRRVKESDTMRALSQLSNKDGRRSNANNLVLDDMNLDFDELDARVNEYPQYRPFCVIGSGGDDFVSSIIEKAELALGRSIPKDKINLRPSKEGKWVSVKLGPLYVEDKETVVAVYTEMKKETRIRYCL